MAADIEQIFQDFILNKIREIEDQKEDKGVRAGPTGDGAGQDPAQGASVGPEPSPGPDPVQGHAHKKHKKQKKHKSKKKRNRDRDTGSESGTDGERDRRGTSPQTSKDPGEDGDGRSHRHHSTGKKKKKKKKKRRRKDNEDSSQSEGEKDPPCSSLRRQEDLPDIIPKQDSSTTKSRGDQDRHSPSPSTKRSPSPKRSSSCPCETRPALEEPPPSTQHASESLETPAIVLQSVEKNEEQTEQNAGALVSTSIEPEQTTVQLETPPNSQLLKKSKKPSHSPHRSKDAKSSKKKRRSKSPHKRLKRKSRSKSPSHRNTSCSKSPSHLKRSCSKSPSRKKRSRSKSPSHRKRSCTKSPSHRKRPSSRSPSKRKRSRSKSPSYRKRSRPKSPSYRKRSRSKSPSHRKRSRSKTPSYRKRSRSKSPSHRKRSRSKTPSYRKRSRSKSPSHRKRSRSKSPSHRKRSRSKSPSHRKRSRSKSPSHRKRSRSKSPSHRKSSRSKSPSHRKRSTSKSSSHRKRSRSKSPSHRKRSRSKTPSHRKRSRSRGHRSSWRSRSRSVSRSRKRVTYSQRDRWKREPSHSPVLILRKNRSPSRKHSGASGSPQRISDLDKEQLLEIAKANAAAMCAKAGMPVPASLRTSMLPLALPSMAMNAAMASMTAATVTAALSNMSTLSSLLPSISNKPPSSSTQPSAALEDVRKRVEKQANSLSIKEFTDKCQMIVDSSAELPVALPHVSDEEDDGKSFAASTLREQKVINFSINNLTVRPAGRSDADMAKEFPVSSGSQHRKKEGDGAYGEWVPVEKSSEKASKKAPTHTSPSVEEPPAVVQPEENVFPEPPVQSVDITQAVTERIRAQRRLAENPYDITAMCMLSRAQEQVDAWAQSNTVPGLFTGSTGAQVLSSEELSSSGPQAWLKKDQFLRAAPVSGGVGEFLMRKMGWRTGEGLGRNREGTVEPIVIDFKVDRKGLVAEGEKPQKQTGGLVVTKDLMGKHPVSALIELCNKKRIMQPDFVMVHHSGPDHRKNFLFKVTVNGVDYQPQTASPNKKHAKAMAATVALQALGEVSSDGPGLYTGPVFTAASTGPLFST